MPIAGIVRLKENFYPTSIPCIPVDESQNKVRCILGSVRPEMRNFGQDQGMRKNFTADQKGIYPKI